jgi:dienelactone hydrolase
VNTVLRRRAAIAGLATLILAGCSPSGSAAARGQATAGSPPPPSTTAPPTTAGTTTTVPAAPPYPVTTTTIPFVDAGRPTVSRGRTLSGSRPLTTQVWAPAVPGRWPLVVFGHGYQVGPGPYSALLRAWAADGYVVAAPEFPLSDQAVAGANLDENDINNEPGDLRFVLDSLVAPASALAARIDPARVALAGHSDGAEAAVAEAISPVPPGQPAVHAVIAMSVNALPGIPHLANPPVLVTQGDADAINPFADGRQTYADARSPKYFLTLLGGGHLPPLEAGSAWLPTIITVSEDFLHLYLNNTGSRGALETAGNRPPLTTLQPG